MLSAYCVTFVMYEGVVVIELTAQRVGQGKLTEDQVLQTGDVRFSFLKPENVYHAFYQDRLSVAKSTAAEDTESLEKVKDGGEEGVHGEGEAEGENGESEDDLQPLPLGYEAYPAPVSDSAAPDAPLYGPDAAKLLRAKKDARDMYVYRSLILLRPRLFVFVF